MVHIHELKSILQLCNKQTNKCKSIKYVSTYSTTHQHVLVPLPTTIASILLPSNLPALHTLVSSDHYYGTHFYLTNRYAIIMTTVIPNIQLLVYYIDGVIPTAMLFLLQGEYQICPAKKQHKHAQFHLLFRDNITSSFMTIRGTQKLIVTSGGFKNTFCTVVLYIVCPLV